MGGQRSSYGQRAGIAFCRWLGNAKADDCRDAEDRRVEGIPPTPDADAKADDPRRPHLSATVSGVPSHRSCQQDSKLVSVRRQPYPTNSINNNEGITMDRRAFLTRSFFLSAGILMPRLVLANSEPVVETAQGRVRGRVTD